MPPYALKSTSLAFTFVSMCYLWNHELICYTFLSAFICDSYILFICVYSHNEKKYFVNYPLFSLRVAERTNTQVTCKRVRRVKTRGQSGERARSLVLLAAVSTFTAASMEAAGRGRPAEVLIGTSTAVTFLVPVTIWSFVNNMKMLFKCLSFKVIIFIWTGSSGIIQIDTSWGGNL